MTQRRHCTLVGGNGGGKRWENFSLSMPDFNLLKLYFFAFHNTDTFYLTPFLDLALSVVIKKIIYIPHTSRSLELSRWGG